MTATEENEDWTNPEKIYRGLGLSDPVKTAEDKWLLLPAFLKVKGLIKQHIVILSSMILITSSTRATVLPQTSIQRFPSSTPNIYVGMPEQDDHGGGGGTGGAGDRSVTPQNAG